MVRIALAVFLLMSPVAASASETMPWEQVREAVGECICMLTHTFEGREGYGYSPILGDRSLCGAPAADNLLREAVDAAFQESQPLIVSVHPGAAWEGQTCAAR